MKGLSEEIELSVQNSLEGMNHDIDVEGVSDEKLSALVKSRIESFVAIKEMILSWQNSPNAPSHEKLRRYITELVGAGDNSIDVLRKALSKKINFDELDADRYGIAIKSKPVILKAITDINAGNIELRLQIESDKFDLNERDFKRGYPEKFANQEFYPAKNYHKEWYDAETDSVMICPLGTKGEVITLDGLNITLPKRPSNKKDILFHRYSKEEQYWRRQEIPAGLTPDTESVFADFIMQEFKRRREGVWFMNNGQAVYVTPAHYMGLQWNQMADTGGYKEFRMAQALMYYHAKACIVDPRSLGELFVKGRRTGFTEDAIDHIVDSSTSKHNSKYGMTSKTGEDALVVYLKYSYVIQNLPFFFQPVVKGKIDDVKKMVFGKPSDNSRASKKLKDNSTKDYLNTTVDYRATSTLAYDSTKLDLYLGDEASKWERPHNYIDHWSNIRPTMVQGGRVVGKSLIGSTLNPREKGGNEFIKLDEGSNVLKRNANGRTVTGLYSYFLPAHHNMEDFTDKYGVCHQTIEKGKSFINAQGELKLIGSLQFLENEFASARLLGEKFYWNARRLDPITKQDAFRDEATSTIFDEQKINDQLDHNETYDTRKHLTRGNFSWENNEPDTKVIWTPNAKGRFLVGWIPPADMQNKWIMKRNEFGHTSKTPLNDDLGAFGIDTYDQDSTQGSKLEDTENGSEYSGGSKGAMLGLTGMTMRDAPSNFFFLEYITRPQTAEIFFEDNLMACVFYGMPALIESNKTRLLLHFRNRGYRGFSINRFDKPMNKLSQTEKDLGGVPSSGDEMIRTHWTGIESYIDKYVGKYVQGQNTNAAREEGEMGSMPFERTLRDWLGFNVKDRTKFDATIASGYAIMAVNRRPYIEPRATNKNISIKFQTYS
jgi:hypothetical protein